MLHGWLGEALFLMLVRLYVEFLILAHLWLWRTYWRHEWAQVKQMWREGSWRW